MRRYIFLAAVCAVSSGPANAQDWIGPTPLDLGIQFSNQIGSAMMLDTMMSHIDNARENAEHVSPDLSVCGPFFDQPRHVN